MKRKNIYWAIATSTKYPNVCIEKIDALSDQEARTKAEKWNKEHNGFCYTYVVAKEITKKAKDSGNKLTARIERIAHDQGGGSAFCGNCKQDLGSDLLNEPEICPGCGRKLIKNYSPPFINLGGSDF